MPAPFAPIQTPTEPHGLGLPARSMARTAGALVVKDDPLVGLVLFVVVLLVLVLLLP